MTHSRVTPGNAVVSRYWRWIAGIVVALLLIGTILPSRVNIERGILVDAHPATIFALLNDFRQVEKWASKTEQDPNARVEFGGPPRGPGASISWRGQIAGQGRQEITDSRPFEQVTSRIDLGKGQEATVIFTIGAQGDLALVGWTWEREYGWRLAARLLGLVNHRVIGDDMERALSELKELAERLPRADFSDLEVEHIVVEAADIAWKRATSLPEATAISEAMGDAYFEILQFIDSQDLQEAGAPLSITRNFSGSELVFDAAIPVRGLLETTPRNGNTVKIGATYAGPVIRTRHVGSYATLARTHDKIAAYLAAMGIRRNGDAWESYVSDPTRTAESQLLTYIYYPVQNPE